MAKTGFMNKLFNITPGTALPFRPDDIYVGTMGHLTVTDEDGRQVIFKNAIGWVGISPVSVDAGTTALDIVGGRSI
jgi:hypothetical protein